MNRIEGLKTTLQSLCNISAEDATVPAEILTKVLGVCFENQALRSKIENLKELSTDLISRLENASRESERMKALEQQIMDLRGRNTTLENNLRQKDIAINDLNNKLSEKELHINNLSSQISNKESELNVLHQDCNNLETIRNNYETLDIFPFYEKLSDRVKDSLSNIFHNISTPALLSSGIQENNITRLYDFLENRVREDILDNYEELNVMIRKLFDIYNLGRKEPYVIIEPVSGSKYDNNENIIKNNAMGGAISKVWLFGYKTARGIVQKKAFVEVL
ncbi:MAG: hypothetical protein II852_09830 [Bacteroidales bacterium]|nr:hypothetical protein [Bacteroidales bacterium]